MIPLGKYILPGLFCIIVIFAPHIVFGATYYFSSSTGDDSRSHIEAQHTNTPWRSIEKLNKIFTSLNPGDQVLFKRGEEFHGSININQSGILGYPITLGAYGVGKKPVITSMVTVNGWIPNGNNLYEAKVEDISGDLSILTIAGSPYAMGRYPNESEENGGYLTIKSHNGKNLVSTDKLKGSPNFNGGEIVIRKNNWIIDRHTIIVHSGTSFQYDSHGSKYKPENGYGFFIQNHPGVLDKLGEWYYDRSAKKLLLYHPGGSPSLANVRVATKDVLMNIGHQTQFVEIKGLVFEGSNHNNIQLENTENITILDCEIRYTGKNAVHIIASPYFTLQNSLIQHSYNGGVFIQWSDSSAARSNNPVISNNVFENTFIFAGMGQNSDLNGIAVYMSESTHNGLVEFNKILKTGYSGIYFNGNNTIVKNNFLDTFCSVKDDGAGIYTWAGARNIKSINRKVIGNILINGIGANNGTNPSDPLDKGAAEGIYIDDNSSGVEISGNSIGTMANSGIYIHNAKNIKINNNRVYNARQSLLMVHDDLGEPIRNLIVSGNQFLAKHGNQKALTIKSKANDVQEMGHFKDNIYANPLNPINLISVILKNASGEVIRKEYDLDLWQDFFQHDLNSKSSPLEVSNFKIKSSIGSNKIENGDLDSSFNSLYCWSPNNNCNIQIEEKDGLEGNSLKADFPDIGFVAFGIGEVAEEKAYHLTFSGLGSKPGLVKTYLRQGESPYHVIGDMHTLKIDETQTMFSVLFTAQVNEANTVLIFETVDSPNSFWLNNLVLQEVETALTDPDTFFLFEYNKTAESREVSLLGTYLDLDNNLVSGTMTLAPFSSCILIKKPRRISQASVPNDIATIRITNPGESSQLSVGDAVTITVEVDENKTQDVEKVTYYCCDTQIATQTDQPFACNWKDIPYGEHYLHVKAFDKLGRTITSDSTFVNVRKQNVAPVISLALQNKENITTDDIFKIKGLALDIDGGINLIQIFANNQHIGSTNEKPHYFTWNNGTHLEKSNKRLYKQMEDNIEANQYEASVKEIKLYPNPAKEVVVVELNSQISGARILIHGMSGQLINHFDLSSLPAENNRYMIPLGNISQGEYLVTVTKNLEVVKRLRFLVNR